MIRWKEEYCLGIAAIDEQHMRLIELANEAYMLLANDLITDKYDKIVELIEELKEYTVYHFQCEEEYMEKAGYKRLFSQKIDHADFIEKVNNIDLKKIDEQQDKYLAGILDFIVEWVDFHILKKDKLIAEAK